MPQWDVAPVQTMPKLPKRKRDCALSSRKYTKRNLGIPFSIPSEGTSATHSLVLTGLTSMSSLTNPTGRTPRNERRLQRVQEQHGAALLGRRGGSVDHPQQARHPHGSTPRRIAHRTEPEELQLGARPFHRT